MTVKSSLIVAGRQQSWRVGNHFALALRPASLLDRGSRMAKVVLGESQPGGSSAVSRTAPRPPRKAAGTYALLNLQAHRAPYPQAPLEGRRLRPQLRHLAPGFCARYSFISRRTRVSQVTPESPGTPHAMVYGLYRALPGERLFCHRRLARLLLARLDTSTAMSGPHDFAVRIKRFRQRRRQRPPRPAPR
jgi:hypothetical protein